MIQVQTKLTSQGQVSVPVAVRRLLGLMPGSSLEWQERNGQVVVQRATQHDTLAAHAALFGDEKTGATKAKTLLELKQGIAKHMQQRHARA